jgi:hypothetical protein
MKNNVVTTASGAPYEPEEDSGAVVAVVEVPGVLIAMVNRPFHPEFSQLYRSA